MKRRRRQTTSYPPRVEILGAAMLELRPPLPPMEALPVDEIPKGAEWQYEPKWDGFRCLTFRDGADVYLQSKGLKPLGRYFPEIVEAVAQVRSERFVVDGELVV